MIKGLKSSVVKYRVPKHTLLRIECGTCGMIIEESYETNYTLKQAYEDFLSSMIARGWEYRVSNKYVFEGAMCRECIFKDEEHQGKGVHGTALVEGRKVDVKHSGDLRKLDALMWEAGHNPAYSSKDFAYLNDIALLQRVAGDIIQTQLEEQVPEIDKHQMLEALVLGINVPVPDLFHLASHGLSFENHKKVYPVVANELARNLGNILTIANVLGIDLTKLLKQYLAEVIEEGEAHITPANEWG